MISKPAQSAKIFPAGGGRMGYQKNLTLIEYLPTYVKTTSLSWWNFFNWQKFFLIKKFLKILA